MTTFQITANEIISAICKTIHSSFGNELSIYKEKQNYLELPAVTVYCINYEKKMGRFDRFTNTFNIIINYFPNDSVIIKNKRVEMFSVAEQIMDSVKYINLPAVTKNKDGQYIETILPCRGYGFDVKEKDGFIQIGVNYQVRTVEKPEHSNSQTKMSKIEITINDNC